MKEHREENYNLYVTASGEQISVNDIPCQVYLPRKSKDPIRLHLYLIKAQLDELLQLGMFSLEGEERGPFMIGLANIRSDEVYIKDIDYNYRGAELKECVLVVEAKNLLVVNRLRSVESEDIGKTIGAFWLTPVRHLYPINFPKFNQSGEVTNGTTHQVTFPLLNGINLAFNTHSYSQENEEGDTVTSTQLVAEFEFEELSSPASKIEEILNYLEDFLLLVSFAARKRCVCVGWEFQNKATHTRYYRRDVAIPGRKKEERESWLLLLKFRDFIKVAYEKFNELENKEHLRRAINYVLPLPEENRSIETEFIILYAALETLVLYFRREKGLEKILSQEVWDKVRNDLKKWFKKHPLLTQDPDTRKMIYDKLPELNRVSFAAAFNIFCSTYSINTQDLWPVVDNKDGPSLSMIRNKIVHGETFESASYLPIMTATAHLQWLVERMILVILGWDVAHSEVSESNLAKGLTKGQEWKADLKLLSESLD